jgi:predicted nuclease of predicted toxin-antitoxin system
MVKILLDQNIPAPIADWLQERVGDAAEITSTRMLGTQRMTDQQLFQLCQSQKMVIVTYDEDFQNPLVISKTPGYGVVRLNVYPTGLKQTKLFSDCSKAILSKCGRELPLLSIQKRFAIKRKTNATTRASSSQQNSRLVIDTNTLHSQTQWHPTSPRSFPASSPRSPALPLPFPAHRTP